MKIEPYRRRRKRGTRVSGATGLSIVSSFFYMFCCMVILGFLTQFMDIFKMSQGYAPSNSYDYAYY